MTRAGSTSSAANSPPGAARPDAPWSPLISDEHWAVFKRGTAALEQAGIRYLLHGAMGLATYAGHWRNTKDVDVVVHATDRERGTEALRRAGFQDYHDQLAYDRSWIFRGANDGMLMDLIWALPNHRVEIDEEWFARSRPVQLRGETFAVVPPEELVRVKLYVMQRERCDWVDVLNVLAGAASEIDWRWLVQRMGRDLPLLHGVLAVFNWLCPERARKLPAWVREQFALPRIDDDDLAAMEARRAALFDSRPWFALHQPLDRPLER